jgi:hypothetical protein
MPTCRSSTAARSRRWRPGSKRASRTGAGRLIRAISDCRSALIAEALTVLAAASVLLSACAQQPKGAGRAPEADALNALSVRAATLAREDEFSGAVLVAKDGRVLFSRAYGLADRERRTPNTVWTRFRIGSMTKMFTAVAILQLVEAGKVKLTAALGTYLPDYPNREVATKVTIHQLLTHTSGLGELPSLASPDFQAHRHELRTLADYATRYGKRGSTRIPAAQPLGVQQLRVPSARSGDREGDRGQLLRLCAAARLHPRGNDPQRIAARKPRRPGPGDRIHQAMATLPLGAEHRDAALPRQLIRLELLDGW